LLIEEAASIPYRHVAALLVAAFDFELIDGEDIDMAEQDWGLQVSLRTPLKARFKSR
jgi:hypothetical protein